MGAPILRVVRGEPGPEEVAALVAVLSTIAGAADAGSVPRPKRSAWSDPGWLIGAPVHPGPGGWRASGLPR